MLCIDTTLNLGNLRVDGEYETNNASLQKILPISHNGRVSWEPPTAVLLQTDRRELRFRFTFENVTGAGRVGLVIKEDSLVPQNYDVQYSAEGVLLRVIWLVYWEFSRCNALLYRSGTSGRGMMLWKMRPAIKARVRRIFSLFWHFVLLWTSSIINIQLQSW